MSEAWIYGRDERLATQTARQLAESGFHPRYVRGVGLRPDDRGGGDCDRRAPTLAIVVAAPGERAPSKLCAQLLNEKEMEHVPLLVTLEPGQFDGGPAVRDAHEVLVRPFSTTELVARIGRARERLTGEGSETMRCGSMHLDLATRRLTVGGGEVALTRMEFDLLRFLVTHPGRVFPREALLRAVWDYSYYGGTRTVDVHVRRLRAKLGPEHACRIRTVRGVGYGWTANRS